MTVNSEGHSDNAPPDWPVQDDDRDERIMALERLVAQQGEAIHEFYVRLYNLEHPNHVPLDWPDNSDPLVTKCQSCGLEWSGTMGYVCSLSDCPMQAKVGDFPFGINTGG